MNRKKLIPILLFLLLLLIILCTWCHTDKIVKNQAISSTAMIHSKKNVINPEPINFYLQKNKNTFKLQGNFSNQQEVAKIHSALGIQTLNNASIINENLIPKDDVITLTQTLLPLFNEKYETGSIHYKSDQLVVEGTVSTQADKDALSTLLANSTVPSKNNTVIIPSQPTLEQLAAIKAQKEAKLQELEEKKAQLLAEEKAAQEAKELANQENVQSLAVQAIEKEIKKIIAFEDINFELNKATLTQKSIETVSQIAAVLKEHQNVYVEIEGHTDDSGDENYNLTLSQSRVDSVKQKLIEMAITSNRINAIGYGESKPLVSNDTEENRRKNRRVQFKVKGE